MSIQGENIFLSFSLSLSDVWFVGNEMSPSPSRSSKSIEVSRCPFTLSCPLLLGVLSSGWCRNSGGKWTSWMTGRHRFGCCGGGRSGHRGHGFLDQAGFYGKLGPGDLEDCLRDLLRNSRDLENDSLAFHPGVPVIHHSLTLTHTHLSRLGRGGCTKRRGESRPEVEGKKRKEGRKKRLTEVWKDPHPHLADLADTSDDDNPGRLDLLGGEPGRVQSLEAVGAVGNLVSPCGDAVDSPLKVLLVGGLARLHQGANLLGEGRGERSWPHGRRRWPRNPSK